MRFKVSNFAQDTKHLSLVSCIAWLSNDEIYSIGEDHLLLRWNTLNRSVTKVAELADDVFPTSLHCLPRSSSSKKSSSDIILLITCTDGKMLLLSATGRVEKTVDGHKAAILCSQLSRDGSSVVTGAEDGSVKVWSRSIMLRSTVTTNSTAPVFSCDWSPDSQVVAYAQGGSIVLKPLSPSLTTAKWQGHEGVILSLAWSSKSTGTLASGAEDCRYKVWDAEGRLLYSSTNQGSPVTSLSWSWNSKLLAVGIHDSLRLCHASGWSHSVERLSTGGIHAIVWSKDNSQIGIACGSGDILTACVVDREVEAGSVEAHMTSQKLVKVRDLETSDHWENIETKSAILQLVANHGHVAIATTSVCLVYNLHSINTPAEIKLPGVFLLQITAKFLLAVNENGYWVYTLDGRPVALPRIPSLQPLTITEEIISLSPDTLAILDHVDQRVVHFLEVGSLRGADVQNSPRLRHVEPIQILSLNQTEQERCLAIVDTRGDLYISLNPGTSTAKTCKLASMVRDILWNNLNPYLSVLTESQMMVWFYPQIVSIDRSLLPHTVMERELSELGSGATLIQFNGGLLEIRKQDQVAVYVPVCPAPAALFQLTEKSQWDKALMLLRRISLTSGMKPGCMHSVYAARCRIKMQAKRALIAYSALGCVDSVELLMTQE